MGEIWKEEAKAGILIPVALSLLAAIGQMHSLTGVCDCQAVTPSPYALELRYSDSSHCNQI